MRAGAEFFDRPTVVVARDLLGTQFRVRAPDGWHGVRLVEVEAYLHRDPASHAFRGPTRRNRSMFGPPGTLYMFRIHQVVCANLVTRSGEAVLLRAGAPLDESLPNPSGPGRLCRALGLRIEDDGLYVPESDRVELLLPEPTEREPAIIVRSPRVGIRKAAERPLRFSISRDRWVSRPRPRARLT
jgi:DNA-3-methyladenine glycosylase